eukprot:1564650-Karenia_brevis.AAC.1
MKKTVLRGQASVFGKEVIDSIRVVAPSMESGGADAGPRAKRSKRESIKLGYWEAVMKTGFGQYRVGTFNDGKEETRKGPRVIFDLPAEEDECKVQECHNRLMQLCGVGYTSFCEAINQKAVRTSTRKRPAEATGSGAVEQHAEPAAPAQPLLTPEQVARGPGSMKVWQASDSNGLRQSFVGCFGIGAAATLCQQS